MTRERVGRLPAPTIHRVGKFDDVVKGFFAAQCFEKSRYYPFGC